MSARLDLVPGGVFSLSDDLRIVEANDALGALVQRSAAELIGELFDVLLSAPSRILFQTHVYPALKADGRVEEVFLTLASPTEGPIPVLLNATRSAAAGDAAYEGLLVRIRARARWEADLLAATRELERERAASERLAKDLAAAAADLEARHAAEQRSREFRDAFVGVIGHELRTPVTTIYGMTNLLRRRHSGLSPEVVERELLDIEEESDRLRRLTEDLLVLSRAEAGRLVVAADPIVIARIVDAAVARERARSAGHEFAVDADPELPIVLGEGLYVEQVVRNYVSNAGKYSPAGTTVRVAVTSEDGGVAVRVTDEGPGLPDGPPEQLFDLFYRSSRAVAQTSGAGIGLFVCRELVRAMGGRVWAAPAPAKRGAQFGFWLPAMADDA